MSGNYPAGVTDNDFTHESGDVCDHSAPICLACEEEDARARAAESIEQEADTATNALMSGAGLSVRALVRRAYLMGRHDSNARTLDELIKRARGEA